PGLPARIVADEAVRLAGGIVLVGGKVVRLAEPETTQHAGEGAGVIAGEIADGVMAIPVAHQPPYRIHLLLLRESGRCDQSDEFHVCSSCTDRTRPRDRAHVPDGKGRPP